MKELLSKESESPNAAEAVNLFCYQAKKFLGAFAAGTQSPSFIPTFMMTFLALLGIYLTLRGIVMHSIVEVIKKPDSVQ